MCYNLFIFQFFIYHYSLIGLAVLLSRSLAGRLMLLPMLILLVWRNFLRTMILLCTIPISSLLIVSRPKVDGRSYYIVSMLVTVPFSILNSWTILTVSNLKREKINIMKLKRPFVCCLQVVVLLLLVTWLVLPVLLSVLMFGVIKRLPVAKSTVPCLLILMKKL